MLEKDRPPTAEVVKHIDRCLPALPCMTTCPSGVELHASGRSGPARSKEIIEGRFTERLLRAALAFLLPRPGLFRASMILAGSAGRWRRCCRPPKAGSATPTLSSRIKAMLALAPSRLPAPGPSGGAFLPSWGKTRAGRGLLAGLRPAGAGAAHQSGRHQPSDAHGSRSAGQGRRVLAAHDHHLGRDDDRLARARANIAVWLKGGQRGGLTPSWWTTSGAGRYQGLTDFICAKTATRRGGGRRFRLGKG